MLHLAFSRLKQLAVFLCVLGWVGLVHSGAVVVTSERSASYEAAADAVLAEWLMSGQGQGTTARLQASEIAATDAVLLEKARVFITLGAEALRKVLALRSSVPVVAALIPRSGFERVMAADGRRYLGDVSVLYLDQPFGRQLDLVRLAMPNAQKIGVLWGPESIQQRARFAAALKLRDLQERSGEVLGNGAVSQGLKAALEDADVLLAVADPQVFNSATIANILLATYRSQIPVVGFSPSYVRAGALLSIHSTPAQVGTQAGALARSVLNGQYVIPSQYPAEFTIEVNTHVARSLGLELDAAVLSQKLRQLERKP